MTTELNTTEVKTTFSVELRGKTMYNGTDIDEDIKVFNDTFNDW